jgi:hypothetical protein
MIPAAIVALLLFSLLLALLPTSPVVADFVSCGEVTDLFN